MSDQPDRIKAVLELCDVDQWEGENAAVLAERVRDLLLSDPTSGRTPSPAVLVEQVLDAEFGHRTYPLDGVTTQEVSTALVRGLAELGMEIAPASTPSSDPRDTPGDIR